VTTAGGTRPAWTRGGQELVYLTNDGDMMALAMDGPAGGMPQRLFTADIYRDLVGRTFDVSPDGERFLVVTGLGRTSPPDPEIGARPGWRPVSFEQP
jgi:hypothetical protein